MFPITLLFFLPVAHFIPSQLSLKVHYRALTDLFSAEDQKTYAQYIWLKSTCEGLTQKPGFLAVSQIKKLAERVDCSQSVIYKRLNFLSRAGAIQKTKFGYILTNTNLVLDNLFQFKRSIKNQKKSVGENTNGCKGRLYHPYCNMTIPMSSDLKQVKLAIFHALLKQIKKRKSKKTNGFYAIKSSARRKHLQNSPERLTNIALDYLRKAGKYSTKMTVNNLLEDLQKIGLVKIHKMGIKEGTDLYNINEYTIYPFGKAKWNLLNTKTDKQIERDLITKLNNADYYGDKNALKLKSALDKSIKKAETIKLKAKRKIKKVSVATKKTTTILTDIEQRFIDLIQKHKSFLVVKGFISYDFLNKKVRKNMFKGILNKMMANDGMKEFLLTKFSLDNFNIEKGTKSLYASNATVYSRQFNYPVDIVTLVVDNGNYEGQSIKSYEECKQDAISDRQDMTKVDTTGKYLTTLKPLHMVSSHIL